jgi:GNAT superfamily N-acetyltransferase
MAPPSSSGRTISGNPDCKPGERSMTIARSLYEDLEIIPVDARNTEIAVSLLHRYFQEEGFSGDRSIIAANLEWMRRDDNHWAALALYTGHFVGIVTVTSMLYIEWGRLGEIGDLYVLPEARGNGVARRLVQAAIAWCRARGCSAVEVINDAPGRGGARTEQFLCSFWFCCHWENYFAFAA